MTWRLGELLAEAARGCDDYLVIDQRRDRDELADALSEVLRTRLNAADVIARAIQDLATLALIPEDSRSVRLRGVFDDPSSLAGLALQQAAATAQRDLDRRSEAAVLNRTKEARNA